MKVLTIAEAANLLPLSKWTLYRLAEAGEAPFRKRAGKWMAMEDDLIEWIRAGEKGSSREPTTARGSGRIASVNHYRELRNGKRSQN
jgi:excisionase family DNA binding protein